ncbi:MAG TPA: dodecin family protein [Balneolales bacterium]|nr:dodecin family protein [Balneolales bacterium]
MALAKVIEVLAEGISIEDAIEKSVKQSTETVQNVKNVYVEHIQAVVEDNEVVKYRINAKVTFVIEHKYKE